MVVSTRESSFRVVRWWVIFCLKILLLSWITVWGFFAFLCDAYAGGSMIGGGYTVGPGSVTSTIAHGFSCWGHAWTDLYQFSPYGADKYQGAGLEERYLRRHEYLEPSYGNSLEPENVLQPWARNRIVPFLQSRPASERLELLRLQGWGITFSQMNRFQPLDRIVCFQALRGSSSSSMWWARKSSRGFGGQLLPPLIPTLPGLLLILTLATISGASWLFGSWSFQKLRRRFYLELWECGKCRYDLRGIDPSGNCPECGKPIERADTVGDSGTL